jgi:decaprenylphospho-beta-D-erythro-pentofuranosid-2-ulose 2-reductase
MKNFVIFGATSAIAQAVARLWAARGANLFLVGRNGSKLEAIAQDLRVRAGPGAKIHCMQADLDVLDAHGGLIRSAREALGGLDCALIAQGTLPDQKACEGDVALALSELRTNGIAIVSLCGLLANDMEEQGRGCIAVVTSVAGDRGRQSNYVYGAAKGMVSRYLQGLRNRLHRAGVSVVDIRPGFVDTPMTAGISKKGLLWAQPATVAAGIVAAIDNGRDIVYLPRFWAGIMFVIRTIPETVFKRLKL